MNKIVRGKIKSIDASIGKRKEHSHEKNIDVLEYIITLDNGRKYQTNCSIGDFKVSDKIDIVVFKKIKEDIKDEFDNDCLILNKHTANKILNDEMYYNTYKYLLFVVLCYITIPFMFGGISESIFQLISPDSPSDSFFAVFVVFIIFGCMALNTIKGIKNRKSLFSKEEYALMEKYRNNYNIKNEEYLNVDKVKQKEVL